MTEHHIPKGVSPETLREVLVGWSEVGAAAEPRYTAEVEEVTSVSDVVGRQTRFLEEIGVLEPHKQKHELTDAGEELASALAEGDEERARAKAREVLSEWDLTEDVRGLVEANPMAESDLVPLTAELAGQDLDTSRVETGLTTLLEFYEWADLLDRDEEGRYRLPETGNDEETAAEEEEPDESADERASENLSEDTEGTEESAVEAADLPTEEFADAESTEELLAAIADTATEAKRAAEEARVAAEEAQSVARQGADGSAAATEPHAISLDLDVDPQDLEAIVRGLKRGMTEPEN